jgi:hypothetical protein
MTLAGVLRRAIAGTAAVAIAMSALVAIAGPVAAADPVTFGKPTATSTYGEAINFKQPVDLATRPQRVELLMQTPGGAGPGVIDVDAPTGSGPTTLTFNVALADGHIVPNTKFTARWRVTDENGRAWVGPPFTTTYADTRVKWKTLDGDFVRLHWYEGGDDFGRRALKIGDDAVKATSELLGVKETEPIDFFIYADQDKFYDALGPATRENVGGEAHADIRTMFALITPGEINDSWVSIVVPHELTHLVFDTATKNPYHDPPHWLNEGLAVYLSQGYGASDRNTVEAAAKDGSIMPLDGLVGAFPTTRDRFFLAYAESVSAVDWIVANKGSAALISLIKSYADGVSDDEAFKSALGLDAAAFQQAWLSSVGASAPVRHGPVPAPVGPLPEGWSGAAPNGSPQPGATLVPGVPATPPAGSPSGQPAASSGMDPGTFLVVGLVALVLVAGAIVLVANNRRTKAAAPGLGSHFSGGFSPPPPPVDGPPATGPFGSSPPAEAPPVANPWARPDEPPVESPWARPPEPASDGGEDPGSAPATTPPSSPAPAESPESRPPAAPES